MNMQNNLNEDDKTPRDNTAPDSMALFNIPQHGENPLFTCEYFAAPRDASGTLPAESRNSIDGYSLEDLASMPVDNVYKLLMLSGNAKYRDFAPVYKLIRNAEERAIVYQKIIIDYIVLKARSIGYKNIKATNIGRITPEQIDQINKAIKKDQYSHSSAYRKAKKALADITAYTVQLAKACTDKLPKLYEKHPDITPEERIAMSLSVASVISDFIRLINQTTKKE